MYQVCQMYLRESELNLQKYMYLDVQNDVPMYVCMYIDLHIATNVQITRNATRVEHPTPGGYQLPPITLRRQTYIADRTQSVTYDIPFFAYHIVHASCSILNTCTNRHHGNICTYTHTYIHTCIYHIFMSAMIIE